VLTCLLFLMVPARAHALEYTDLYSFHCLTDGCVSYSPGGLTQGTDGNLYGTLVFGGAANSGTVFKITPSGTFTTLYSFTGGKDGSNPYSGVTLGSDGNFYGTTVAGGPTQQGTIFKITPAGVLTTLHTFTGADGIGPRTAPVEGTNGSYYGVTYNNGTAYSITSNGTFKLLSTALPQSPQSPLILASDGNFYGTSTQGGTLGIGTVYRMTPTGAVKIIYSFDGTHGSVPYGPVVQGSDGFLYGTTGASGPATTGGVVFKLSTAGKITVLHQFDSTSTSDGYQPEAGLIAATDGNFYGATSQGVPSSSTQYGTLFKITKTGAYSIQYVFDQAHGANQYSNSMQHTNGSLYATPSGGGPFNTGVLYSLVQRIPIPPCVSIIGYPAASSGQTVQMLGTGLTGTTSVKFGAATANFKVVSDTYLTAVVPSAGTSGALTIITPSGALKSKQNFKVVPTIVSFKPGNGPVGTQVTITGTGLTGATKVTFGGVKAALFTVNSGTQVKAAVPTGAKTGKIAIATAGGTAASSATFTVN
jgi:uncharacterized repeat protein (TIGR03803 family)